MTLLSITEMVPPKKKVVLKEPDPIRHQGLDIALAAFRLQTPSLYAEAGELSLGHRRLKLSMSYSLEICFDPITNSLPSELFEKSKTDPQSTSLPHLKLAFVYIFKADNDPAAIDDLCEHTPT